MVITSTGTIYIGTFLYCKYFLAQYDMIRSTGTIRSTKHP